VDAEEEFEEQEEIVRLGNVLMRRTRIVRIARRVIPNIRVGTESYPEKIARRLRAFNIAVWIAAMVPGTMAFVRFFDGKLAVGIADIFVATIYASMPLLHRLGPLVAPIAFVSVSYAVIFWVNSLYDPVRHPFVRSLFHCDVCRMIFN